MVSALLVVDIQPDFYAVVSETFPNFHENVEKLLHATRETETKIIHVRANYQKSSKWMTTWSEMVSKSKKGVEGEISPDSVCHFAKEIEGELIIAKPAFDGFFDTNLNEILQENNIDHVYVCGLITSCCVLFTTASAFFNGYKITIITDCCADRTVQKHEHTLDVYGRYMFYSKPVDQIISEAMEVVGSYFLCWAEGTSKMFFQISLTKNVNIPPKDCGPGLRGPIENKLYKEVQGTMGVNGCHIVAIIKVDSISEGRIQDETGYAMFFVKYTALVFRPIRNEVIDAIVISADDKGIQCEAGPLLIYITPDNIPSNYEFDNMTQSYVMAGQMVRIQKSFVLRVKLFGISWQDRLFATGSIKDDFLGLVGTGDV